MTRRVVQQSHEGAHPPRWWSSVRLLTSVSIVVTMVIVLAAVLLVARQFLRFSTDQTTNARIERQTSEFSSFTRTGIIPATGQPSPSVVTLLRAYLAQQYPEDDILLVATPASGESQLTLSKNPPESDPLFPAAVRSHLQTIGRDAVSPPAGTISDTSIRWGKIAVTGPRGPSSLVVAVNPANSERAASAVLHQLTLAATIGVLFMALCGWLLAGRILQPVRTIREVADTISADDLSRRVPEGGADEFAALARTVNAMLDRVESAYRTQREFLDDAGHELRTPLTVVQGYLDLMPEDPAERAETQRIVQDELTRMARIVEDLLTLARSNRPDFVQLAAADLAELTIDVELKTEVMADRRWDVRPEAEGTALLDRQRITQALLQFCANAVRFTKAGDAIEIGCRIVQPGTTAGPIPDSAAPPLQPVTTPHILWWVLDSGPGIPTGQEHSIFERFTTARGQLRDGRGGTGLGLAIVSMIAAAHKGRTFAYNADQGGACFCLMIPLQHVSDSH